MCDDELIISKILFIAGAWLWGVKNGFKEIFDKEKYREFELRNICGKDSNPYEF